MNFFSDLYRRNKKIKLFWFRHKYPHSMNFGDELSREIVENLSGRKVVWADRDECELIALGSVLKHVLSRKTKNHVLAWGSGLMFDEQSQLLYDDALTDIRMVRGKLTADRLGLNHSVFGDPCLLVDLLCKPSRNKKRVGVVPHYVDKNHPIVGELSKNKDVKIIDVYAGPRVVASEIASCELVVSSSLHGIITAHSFGIPAYWVELSNDVAGNGFKFRDHYSVFGQAPQKLSLKELREVAQNSRDLISNYEYPAHIDEIKEQMIAKFPTDI